MSNKSYRQRAYNRVSDKINEDADETLKDLSRTEFLLPFVIEILPAIKETYAELPSNILTEVLPEIWRGLKICVPAILILLFSPILAPIAVIIHHTRQAYGEYRDVYKAVQQEADTEWPLHHRLRMPPPSPSRARSRHSTAYIAGGGARMTKPATSGVSPRDSIAQFLARNDADSLTMRARIRGIDEPEEARKFARIEAERRNCRPTGSILYHNFYYPLYHIVG